MNKSLPKSENAIKDNINNKFNEEKQKITEALEEYESQKAGLPSLGHMDAPEYISMNINILKKKSAYQLCEAAFELRQYALYLQRMLNKEKAWKSWAESKLDEITADELLHIAGHYGWNERMLLAKTQNPICKKLNSFLREVSLHINRLLFIPNEIHKLADTINDLKFAALRLEESFKN